MRTNFFFATVRIGRATTLAFGLAMILAVVLLFGLQAANPAHAVTRAPFTVNSTGDENDLDFPGGTFDGSSDGKCDGDFNTDGDQCTLRAAIQQANVTKSADTIAFNIPGGVGKTISPSSALPAITHPVTIDGYTQPGSKKNDIPLAKDGTNTVLVIELDGSIAGGGVNGLQLNSGLNGANSSNSVIRGLVFEHFSNSGILLIGGGTGYKIEGNFIGTDPSGFSDFGNAGAGVSVQAGPSHATIGGTSPADRNLISGNFGDGIDLATNPGGHKIEGNLIGTTPDPTLGLGNGRHGVFAIGPSNTIGDSDPSDGATNAANTIAFNDHSGVLISESQSVGTRILSNSIFNNHDLGINLSGGTEDANGVTANDPNDPDTGPNNLQNYPEITSAQNIGDSTSINGTLESTPSTKKKKRTFIIQFFSSPGKDPSDYGQGKTFLGQIEKKTDRQGKASFSFAPFPKVPVGQFVTATATNKKTGDTSEFSKARVVEPPVIGT